MSILDSFKLDGQTAVVTGARRGIGLAIAVALAQAGADIIGVSATLDPDGGEVARLVTAAGRSFKGYACDFQSRDAVKAFIQKLRHDEKQVDILVNNAGTIQRMPASIHSDEAWDEVLNVNLTAPFILSREIGKDMLSRRKGKIIFTASLLSFQGGINVPGYAASKGAIAQLTKALANEWASHGVNVNAIAPGYIETDNTAALRNDPARATAILSRIPAARWGAAADLGGAAVFLASRASDYVHGTILTVDGGWMGR